MKLIITSLLIVISVALSAQDKNTGDASEPVVNTISVDDNAISEPLNYLKDDQMFSNEYIDSEDPIVKKNVLIDLDKVYFPEGFTMNLPKNEYFITKEKGKYTFKRKDNAGEYADFEVFITNYDIQKNLTANNYFLVSKNKNLALYGVYTINEETKTREILGFRLFYTIHLENDIYVTNRSNIFKDYKLNKEYLTEIVNVDPCYDIDNNNRSLAKK